VRVGRGGDRGGVSACAEPVGASAYDRPMTEDDRGRLEEIRRRRQDAFATGRAIDPLVTGPEHALLARRVAGDLRALVTAANDLAELVKSWQYLAGMCGLFDDLEESERPDRDWRARIEQSLALIEEATA
jgi:hypothetical protein